MFKNFQSGIKVFLIVAFVAVVISVGAILLLRNDVRNQVSHTPSEVEEWQTYRNDEFGFEVKYPGDWKVAKNLFALEPSLVFCPANLATDPEIVCTFKTGAINPQYEDGMIYLFGYGKSASKPNNPAYRFVGLDPQGNHYYLYSMGNNEQIFNQILSTFRFIDNFQIQSLEIIPSEKSNEGIVYYQEGAKAIATGMNLSKVEFRQRGGGQIYTSPEGGLIGVGIMTDVKDGEQKWEVSLPSERVMLTLCAVGFDSTDDKVGEVCLHNIFSDKILEQEK